MERGYELWTKPELKDELRKLEASVTGNKPELIQRLRDAKKGKFVKKLQVRTPTRVRAKTPPRLKTSPIRSPTAKKNYSEISVTELRELLRQRGLLDKGLKNDLIKRLEDVDKEEEYPTFLDILPRDILREEFAFTDPKDLRLKCRQKNYQPLCQNDKVLEEFLIKKRLDWYLRKVNEGLNWAAKIGSPEFVDFFIKRSAKDWDYGMLGAAEGGHQDLVEFFIEKGASGLHDAIRIAAYGNHRDLVDFFIKHGANREIGLNGAAEGGHQDLVKFIISKGAHDWEQGLEGAAKGGHQDLVKFFISKGAHDWEEAMNAALNGGHQNLADFFYKKL